MCYGAATYFLGLLATTMTKWEEAERHFEDAMDMNARMGARPWLAHTQHRYAEMLLACMKPGYRLRSISLLDDAMVTSRKLGMRSLEESALLLQERVAASPCITPEYPDGLSLREVEVLRLIAGGKSNREIADELFITSNTIANHVRSILTKTGAANRTEAAVYAIRQGLT